MPARKVSSAVEPEFVKADIEAIKADMKDRKEKVVEGQEFDVPVDGVDLVRTYKYEKKRYVYIGTVDLREGVPVDETTSVVEEEDAPKKKTTRGASKEEDAPKKKTRKSSRVELADVMTALDADRIEDAKKLLRRFIDQPAGRVRRAPKLDASGNPVEKRRSAYNEFISSELRKLKEEYPDKAPVERMPIAVERYHAWKASQ